MCKKVVIIGGGISGLTAAWYLARGSSRLNVTLLEGSSRIGGWINSDRIAHTGAVHELGPRSMRVAQTAGKIALAMLSELGLESQIIPIKRGHKAAQRRLIYTDKHKLVELPSNISWLITKKPPFSKPLLSSLAREPFVVKPSTNDKDESVHEFITRRLGIEIADWLVNPMCRGVFAGDSKKLSLRSCFPLLHNYEQEHDSIIRGMILTKPDHSGVEDNELVIKARKEKWMIYTLQNGLQTLADALKTASESLGVDIDIYNTVTGISFDKGQVKVITNDNVYFADHVISTISAKALAKILPDDQFKLSSLLNSIPAVDVAVANLEYDGQVIPEKWRQAFGYLVPSHQNSNILGTVFDSSTFPELDRLDKPSTRLTVMMGGEWFRELFGDPDTVKIDTLTNAALESLHHQLGIKQDPLDFNITLQKQCIPQYTVGHKQKLDDINKCVKDIPLSLLGSSYRGVSVNDCIMNSIMEAKTFLSFIGD